MVAQTVFAQLRYSPAFLLLAVTGMGLTYMIGPAYTIAALFSGDIARAALGAAIWLLMAASLMPVLRFYRQTRWAAFLLPFVALLYTAMTVDSAFRHWRGAGGEWKGRVVANSRKSKPQARASTINP